MLTLISVYLIFGTPFSPDAANPGRAGAAVHGGAAPPSGGASRLRGGPAAAPSQENRDAGLLRVSDSMRKPRGGDQGQDRDETKVGGAITLVPQVPEEGRLRCRQAAWAQYSRPQGHLGLS